MIEETFFEICRDAAPAKGAYVSLYLSIPFYGGPEEGGWWGQDTVLVAYQSFPTKEQAEKALEKVRSLAEERNKEEIKSYGNHCLRQSEWLDARGLDDDFLPEPDGERKYWSIMEDSPGNFAGNGDRFYS